MNQEGTKDCYLPIFLCRQHCQKHCYRDEELKYDHEFLCVEQNSIEDKKATDT